MTVMENNVAGLSVPLMAWEGRYLLFALRMSECAGDRVQSVKSLPCEHKDLILRNMFLKKSQAQQCTGNLSTEEAQAKGLWGLLDRPQSRHSAGEPVSKKKKKNNVESDQGRCTRG